MTTPREGGPPREAGAPRETGGGQDQTTPTEPGAAKEPAPREGTPKIEGVAGAKPAPAETGGGPRAEPRAVPEPTKAGSRPGEAEPPKPGSKAEQKVVHDALREAARGNGDLKAAAEAAIGKGGDWKTDLKSSLKGLDGPERVAAEQALVDARENLVNDAWKGVQASDKRFASLTLENAGTKSFASDIDATVRPIAEAQAAGAQMGEQVKLAAEAAVKLSEALRERVGGGETDAKIDTNIYSFIGEGRLKPVDPHSKAAQQHIDVVVGQAEQLRGQRDAQFEAFEQRMIKNAGDPRVADEVRRVVGEAREFRRGRDAEWQAALREAGVPANGKATPAQERIAREAILGVKKAELGNLLGGEPPNYGEIAKKQAEINWFAPDAYATPSAFKQAVAHGQRLKGTATTAARMTGPEVVGKLREQARKLPEHDPRGQRLTKEANLVEQQQRLLDMTLAELKTARDDMLREQEHGPPISGERVQQLEQRAAGLREQILRAGERLLVAEILEITAPADQPGPERLMQSAAASAANVGMMEAHVAHGPDVDAKVKAAAKYAARQTMAEMLAGRAPSDSPMAQLISEFVKSRWSIFEDASPAIMRDMFLRYAELTGRQQDVVRDANGTPIGVTDALKTRFVADAMRSAHAANDGLQLAAIAAKAYNEPALAGATAGGDVRPAPPLEAPGSKAAPAATGPGPGEAGSGGAGRGSGGPGRGGGGGGGGGGPTAPSGPGPAPLPADLLLRIQRVRTELDELGARGGDEGRRARRLLAGLDQGMAQPQNNAERARLYAESIEAFLESTKPAPMRETPLVMVDPSAPGYLAKLETALRDVMSGDATAEHYVAIVLRAYERIVRAEVGMSPRNKKSPDKNLIRSSPQLRAEFIKKLPSEVLPEVRDIFDGHMKQMERGPGGTQGALARGELVWIDRITGDTNPSPGRDKVLWPARDGNVWWVDHIVEIQHGGADEASNYLPLSDLLNLAKTAAMRRWTNLHADARAAGRREGEDVPEGSH